MGGFQLGRPVLLLVNVPDLSRNLLRVAMPCFIPRISGIYMEFEILRRIWRWFSYWGHMLIICLCICISSPQGQDIVIRRVCGQTLVGLGLGQR